jgi:hypothetical protein
MALPAGDRQEHRYQLCNDKYCDRFPCRVYKEGFENGRLRGYDEGYPDGYVKGYDEGYRKGYDDGYGAGFQAGLASCPGPHGSG